MKLDQIQPDTVKVHKIIIKWLHRNGIKFSRRTKSRGSDYITNDYVFDHEIDDSLVTELYNLISTKSRFLPSLHPQRVIYSNDKQYVRSFTFNSDGRGFAIDGCRYSIRIIYMDDSRL